MGIDKFFASEVKSRFSVENFLSHTAEKVRRGTLPCFTEFLASKRFLEKRWLGEYQEFPSKSFCLTLPKKFVGEPISVPLYLGIDKFFASEVKSRFSVENFLSHTAEKVRRGTLLCFTEFLATKTFLEKRWLGEYQEFPSKCFCLTLPKKFVGEPISVSLCLGIDNFYASEG